MRGKPVRHNLSSTRPSDQLLIRVTCQIYFVLTSVYTRQGHRTTRHFFLRFKTVNAQLVELLKALNSLLQCREHIDYFTESCFFPLRVHFLWWSAASPALSWSRGPDRSTTRSWRTLYGGPWHNELHFNKGLFVMSMPGDDVWWSCPYAIVGRLATFHLRGMN